MKEKRAKRRRRQWANREEKRLEEKKRWANREEKKRWANREEKREEDLVEIVKKRKRREKWRNGNKEEEKTRWPDKGTKAKKRRRHGWSWWRLRWWKRRIMSSTIQIFCCFCDDHRERLWCRHDGGRAKRERWCRREASKGEERKIWDSLERATSRLHRWRLEHRMASTLVAVWSRHSQISSSIKTDPWFPLSRAVDAFLLAHEIWLWQARDSSHAAALRVLSEDQMNSDRDEISWSSSWNYFLQNRRLDWKSDG